MKTKSLSTFVQGQGVFFLLITLSGCWFPPDCDFQKEPSLSLSINNGRSYTSCYALKENVLVDGSGDLFSLPVSMNDSRMVYIFQTTENTDTLELLYDKKTAYKEECGFTLSLINLKSGPLTTFESVYFSDKSIHVE